MNRYITRTLEQTISVTPEELAEVFWAMDDEEQAKFFNHLGEIADALPMQLQYVTDNDALTIRGRMTMQYIGEYAEEEV